MFASWISRLLGYRVSGRRPGRRSPRPGRLRRLPPRLEVLEDRTLLATARLVAGVLTVTGEDTGGQMVLSSGGAADRVALDGSPFTGVYSIVVNGGASD